MAEKRIRIVLVDDHAIMRDGVRLLIRTQPDMEVVGEAADSQSALAVVTACSPEVVIMDVQLPGRSGIETAGQILATKPATRIILLSSVLCPADIHHSLKMGISGFVSKVTASTGLIHAVRAVMTGKPFLCSEMTAAVLSEPPPSDGQTQAGLSDREKCLLRLVAEGKRNKEIATQLSVNAKSVEAYRSRLMKKLSCPSTAELVRYAIREKLLVA